MEKEGILSAAKRLQKDTGPVKKDFVKQRQMYCVTKRKFFSLATKEEMDMEVHLYEGQEDKEDAHRILQCRLRYDMACKRSRRFSVGGTSTVSPCITLYGDLDRAVFEDTNRKQCCSASTTLLVKIYS
jgi:hypothetical protein